MDKIDEEIKLVSEKIKDNEWWNKNELRIRGFFRIGGNRERLKESLLSGKNFQLIEVIKKLNIFVEDRFILDSLNIRSNINQHMYYSLYNLYQRKLISIECLEQVKKRFLAMRNAELLFSDVENKFMMSRLEKDRYNFKKIREENAKVYDYKNEMFVHIKNAQPLVADSFQLFSCIYYLEDVLILFNVDVLFSLNTDIPEIEDVLRSLYKPISFLQYNNFRLKKDVSYSMLEFNYENKFQAVFSPEIASYLQELRCVQEGYLNTDFTGFKKPKPLMYFDEYFNNRISMVRKIAQNLKRQKMDFYCVSHSSLSKLLASVVVFDFEFVDFNNLLSIRRSEMFEFLSKKNHLAPKGKILSFGLGLDTINNTFLSGIIEEHDFRMVKHVLHEYL